jgi:hypothetical protein
MDTLDNQQNYSSLEYNSEREALIIPEYGRHLQKLISHIKKIEDRAERNKAAQYVIGVMGSLNPHLRDVLDFQHKLWDQLFIMSDFQLDVDSPYPIPSREVLNHRPDTLEYPQNFPKYRFYGNNIKYMIDVANKWDDGELKNALILVIANHMKKSYLSWNKETVDDDVIFNHLMELSDGKINLAKTNEELSNSHSLMKVNKKISNKSNFTTTSKTSKSIHKKKSTGSKSNNNTRK